MRDIVCALYNFWYGKDAVLCKKTRICADTNADKR